MCKNGPAFDGTKFLRHHQAVWWWRKSDTNDSILKLCCYTRHLCLAFSQAELIRADVVIWSPRLGFGLDDFVIHGMSPHGSLWFHGGHDGYGSSIISGPTHQVWSTLELVLMRLWLHYYSRPLPVCSDHLTIRVASSWQSLQSPPLRPPLITVLICRDFKNN